MISYGLPLYAGGVLSGFAAQYVTLILAAIAINTVVGYYQAASNITVVITLTSSAITLALFPAFASLDGVRANIALAFNYSVKYLAFITSPIILFILGASAPLVTIVYGAAYAPATEYLSLLSLANLPQIVGFSVLSVFFSGVGKTRLTMAFNIIGAAIILALAPLLASSLGFGVNGLIYATLVSNLVSTAGGLYLAKRYLAAMIDPKPILSTLFASILAYACILLLSWLPLPSMVALVADLLVFALAYLTLAPLIGALDSDDVVRLSVVVSELGLTARAVRPVLAYERAILGYVRRSQSN